jgi:flagellar motility protein MotE (MotC chaperone)
MANKSASKSALNQLHEMFAEVMLADLKQSVEEGIPLPAANLGVIRQFLKDNEISASIDADDMAELRDTFADELAQRRAQRQEKLKKSLELGEDDESFLLG